MNTFFVDGEMSSLIGQFNMSDGSLFSVYNVADVDRLFVDINATVYQITRLAAGTINFLIMCKMECAERVLSQVSIITVFFQQEYIMLNGIETHNRDNQMHCNPK